MFNHFTIEGEVLDIDSCTASSGSTRQNIKLKIDSSYFDKRSQQEIHKVAEMTLKMYTKEGKEVDVGDYIVATGRIFVTINPDKQTSYPSFVIEDFAIVL